MTNKSYAMTVSVLRVGLLAAQIATSPSAAAQSTSPDNWQPMFMPWERKIALASSGYRPVDASKAPIYASRPPGGKPKPMKCQGCRGALSTGTACGPQGA